MTIDIKQSTANPVAKDIGNEVIQGRVVSKTVKFAFFTTNDNAVWAGRNTLRIAAFPLATVRFPVNRKMFRYQVGDVFKFAYSKYGVTNMVLRVVRIEEADLSSERITVTAQQDIYSVNQLIIEYGQQQDRTQAMASFEVDPLDYQDVFEAVYKGTETLYLVPVGEKNDDKLEGFDAYISIDGGSSYNYAGRIHNLCPYGALNGPYPGDTYTIDTDTGFTVDFITGADRIDSDTWANTFPGSVNVALLGTELIHFKDITPVSGSQYKISNIIRARGDTAKIDHADGEDFWFIGNHIEPLLSDYVQAGATLKVKLVPYNIRSSGDISEASALDITVSGRCRNPYFPTNFTANNSGFAARYAADIVLKWSARKRGAGAGVGIPGTVLAESDHEGTFAVEVWVGGVKVRTVTGIDATTWTYTAAMNTADNGSLAGEIVFKLANGRASGGVMYSSAQVSLFCRKGTVIEGTWPTTTTTTTTSTTTTTV